MEVPPASVIVTHRERFSTWTEGLDNVLSTVPESTHVVVVDAGSPPSIARALARAAEEHDFLLLRTDEYLTPNQARNLALPYIDSDFVAFVDNDMAFDPGWLEGLVECAESTGAWMVSPVIVQRGKYGSIVHMGGGECGIRREGGVRSFYENHAQLGRSVEDVASLARQRIGFVEFHCVLVAPAALQTAFPLDEGLRSARDHGDLTLEVVQRGGSIWLEPSVIVTQLAMPDRLPRCDRAYYRLRWSDEWNRSSLSHFGEKWDLDPTNARDAYDLYWLKLHRLYGNRAYGGVSGSLPNRPRRAVMRVADRCAQTLLQLRGGTRLRQSTPPRIVHDPRRTEVRSG